MGGFKTKKSRFPLSFLVAKCVPKCDSDAHFIQRALTNNQRRFRRNNTEGSRVVFGRKMCTRSKFKIDFFLHRALKKPRVGFAAKNELRSPSVFFCGEMRTSSQFQCAFSSEGAEKNRRRFRRKNAPGSRFCTRRQNAYKVQIQISLFPSWRKKNPGAV